MTNELTVLTDYIRDELGYEGDIDSETDLLEEQILDSFSIVQMAMYIQETFKVELGPEDLIRENLSKLSSILTLIEKRRN